MTYVGRMTIVGEGCSGYLEVVFAVVIVVARSVVRVIRIISGPLSLVVFVCCWVGGSHARSGKIMLA